jgi:hypothetical protein
MSEKVETIFEEVKKIIVEQLGVAEDKVTLDSTIMEDLGADSLERNSKKRSLIQMRKVSKQFETL